MGKNRPKTGVNKVPSPNPENRVSNDAKNAVIPMRISILGFNTKGRSLADCFV
jgi:hypothetical protein